MFQLQKPVRRSPSRPGSKLQPPSEVSILRSYVTLEFSYCGIDRTVQDDGCDMEAPGATSNEAVSQHSPFICQYLFLLSPISTFCLLLGRWVLYDAQPNRWLQKTLT